MHGDLQIERRIKGGPVIRQRYPNAVVAIASLAHELGQQDEGLEHLARLGRLTRANLPFVATIGERRWVLAEAGEADLRPAVGEVALQVS